MFFFVICKYDVSWVSAVTSTLVRGNNRQEDRKYSREKKMLICFLPCPWLPRPIRTPYIPLSVLSLYHPDHPILQKKRRMEFNRRLFFRRWSRQANRSTSATAAASIAVAALSRLARRQNTRGVTAALARWRRLTVHARGEVVSAQLRIAEASIGEGKRGARRAAAAALVGTVMRWRRRALRWAFMKLRDVLIMDRMKVGARH